MDNKVNMSLQQLETYVQLSVFLTGSKPITIELNPTYYNFYVQEVQRQAEAMGLKPGFNEDKPTFLGIELTKKIEIVVADSSGTVTGTKTLQMTDK